jgi:hypothetical protein
MIRQLLIQRVAQVPAMRQVQARDFDEVPFRADALKEHHQLQLEEDDGVDAGSPTFGVELSRPVADKAQVQRCFEMAVEVVLGEKVLQRDGDRFVEAAGFGQAEHDDGLLAAGADGDGG